MAAESLGTARLDLTVDTSSFEVAIERAKAATKGMVGDAKTQYDSLSAVEKRRVDSLRRQADTLGMTRQEQLAYNVAIRSSGAIQQELLGKIKASTNAVRESSAAQQDLAGQIKATNAAARTTGIAFNQYGLSAKQTAAAMRQVPAQITDIFTSLQGGQNPLTVLIQQGGQLKDVFGGVVPAAKALGGALLGLVNPFTVAAAAIAGVVGLQVVAERQTNAFNAALILSGNQSGITAEQLQAMATSLDQVAGVSGRSAAAALTEIVSSGKIAAESYQLVAEAALVMQQATGKAVSETVAQFAEMARDPVAAILKLNESQHFLTEATLAQIQAFVDQGDTASATALAVKTAAESQIEKGNEIIENLGLVTGAWHEVKRGSAEALDSAVQYFVNLDRRAKESIGWLGRLKEAFSFSGPAFGFNMQAALGGQSSAPTTKPSKPTVDSRAAEQYQALITSNLSKEARQRLEVARIQRLGVAAGKEQWQIQEQINASTARYKESLPKGAKKKSGAGAARSLANAEASAELQAFKDTLTKEQAAISGNTKILQAQFAARLVTTEDYYKRTRQLMQDDIAAQERALLGQIDVLKTRNVAGKDAVVTQRELAELEAKLAKVRTEGATAIQILGIQEASTAEKRTEAIRMYRQELETGTRALQESVNAQIARIGMSEKEAQRAAELAAIYAKQRAELEKLNDQLRRRDIDPAQYDEQTNALRQATDEQVRIVIEGYERMTAAQQDWRAGMRASMKDWADQALDTSARVKEMTTRALDSIADAFVDMALTGKFEFKQLLVVILKEIVAFLIKKAVAQFVMAFLGGFGGGATAGAGGAGGASGMGTGPYAKGAVFTSPSLSKYSGGVYDTPQYFRFARGAGIFGEAGPEAIMPLKRGPDGKLGVQAGGAGGGVNIAVNTTINSDGNSSTNTQSQGDQEMAYKQFTERMRTVAQGEVQRAMRPGGQLWRVGVSA